jgi:polyisoprenyl-phosphate glycosyltransferase
VKFLKVAAIIPAYNEEKTIGDVLSKLVQNKLVNEIIVVSDGSEDKTVEKAGSFPQVRVIDLTGKQGKRGGG